ncbi:MAG: hypothetical protein DHS20C18_15050 [Saprospiraceae bacterium]|nr:MAG: hypothetical protein DHS20C18_15050 [Saprospiraceae bacterium]
MANGVWGQKAKLRKAERAMESLQYKDAIDLYQQILEKQELATAKVRLAEAYRKINDFPQAEYWYGQIVELPQAEAIHFYYYGLMLQRNGRCEEAKEWYDRFIRLKPYDPRKAVLKRACEYQRELMSQRAQKVEVKVLEFNSQYDDIGPAFYEDGLIFGSVRSESEDQGSSLFFHLYYVAPDSSFEDTGYEQPPFGTPRKFSAELDSKAHEAIVSFSRDQQEIFLTRNRLLRKKDRDGAILRLEIMHASRLPNGTWGALKPLPFNNDDYSIAHPALSPDGKRLFFTSDMPGGFGGKDLYVSFREEEEWGLPINLGPKINTEGDELYPFFHADGQLYFSSDGHVGLGGQDIFRSKEAGENEWGALENLGYPINTGFDDFSIIVDETGGQGYFASNRKGGAGADDIYSFRENGELAVVLVKAAKSGDLLENPIFVDSKSSDTLETNTDGELVLRLRPGECRHITVMAQDFRSTDIDLCATDFKTVEFREIILEPVPKIVPEIIPEPETEPVPESDANDKLNRLIVTIVDQYTNAKISAANIHLIGQGCGKDAYEKTDNDGRYIFNVAADCCYQLRVEKVDYFASTIETPVCIGGAENNPRDVNLEISLQAFRQTTMPEAAPTANHTPKTKIPFKISEKRYAGDNSIPYLLNIYYDLGRASVRPEALPELDKLLKLMKDNPKLIVEISSHTDSQGPSSLNMKLSQRRATAIVNYLIKRGINRRQLVAKGYGESRLVNNCSDGVDCSEEKHQMNRRTEFKVLGQL